MMIKDDVTLNDVRHYGDLLDRKDWVYDNANHSLQTWQYGNDIVILKMVNGECQYIRTE